MNTRHLRITAILLVLVMLLPMAACSGMLGKTLMTLEKDGIKVSLSVNMYELMLSRGKGSLIEQKNSVNGMYANQEGFWNYQSKFDGVNMTTYDEYYRSLVLDNCRTYLVAMYLYEKEGLTLPDATKQSIDAQMEELVAEKGNGSKTKLNAVLADYGVNYNILKEIYTMYEKLVQLQKHMYGANAELISTEVKDEYLRDNYVHFQQIYFPNTKFVYETDEFGDVIYFYSSGEYKDHIYYDVENGYKSEKKDKYGDYIYYTTEAHTKIAYNKTYGTPLNVMNGSNYKVESLTDEELEQLAKRADDLYDTLKDASLTTFDEKYEDIRQQYIAKDAAYGSVYYEDGYYIRADLNYSAAGSSYEYLDDIIAQFATLEVGGVIRIASPAGYHIVSKRAIQSQAYANEVNAQWFTTFNSDVINKYFLEMCETHFEAISVNERVLATAPSMKEVTANLQGF